MNWTRTITTENLRDMMTQAYYEAQNAILSGNLLVTLSRPSRSADQNAKFHALINDIQKQCFRGYEFEHLKAALVNQFEHEMRDAGTPLSKPGTTTWDWINQEKVTVRPSTKDFSKAEASAFIEFLYATGVEYNVSWSPIVTRIYDEMRQAA